MTIVCPHFKDEKCSIYNVRPECCRNFPNRQKGMFCSESVCIETCAECKDKCCRHIEATENKDIISLLNLTCSECREKYCN